MAVAVEKYSKQKVQKHTLPQSPVVIVGSGPVGVRTVQELLRLNPFQEIVIYGDEPYEPYNRVRLTQILAGHSTWADIFNSLRLPETDNLIKRYNCPITEIDANAKTVTDCHGNKQPYSNLVLAVGSRPHVPNIDGVDLQGVYTLRDMSDVQHLAARRVRTRKTLVIGGGLLGIEAARALQRSHTEVSIIQHGSRLMSNQLDEKASGMIREHLISLGIKVYLRDGVQEVLGDRLVSGVRLRSGKELEFDTVVLATGITPNTLLARKLGLSVGRGIRVDDQLRTSNPFIYAVGECTEHRGKVYGLVAPGLEQASVAAYSILNRKASYLGSIAAAHLKVVGENVFSIGEVTENDISNLDRTYEFTRSNGAYRKLVVRRGRLVGAVSIGEWSELSRVQEAVTHQRRVWPWQVLRFKKQGDLWLPQEAQDIHQWPATATVCNCTGVTRGALSAAIQGGCKSVNDLAQCTGASSVCGSCKPKLSQMLGQNAEPIVEKGRLGVIVSSILAALVTLMIAFVPSIGFSDSVQSGRHISELWRDGFYKQVTGFTLLGLSVLALIMSLRKRIKKFTAINFGLWRALHAVLGLTAVAVLIFHTGLSLGSHLNFALMMCFMGIMLVGAIAGAVTVYESRNPSLAIGRWRRCATWAHIFLFWPLPVLLGAHVLKTYMY